VTSIELQNKAFSERLAMNHQLFAEKVLVSACGRCGA
jgi:hypothetical protein